MKNFIIFNFITYLVALMRQLFWPAVLLIGLTVVSFGQNNFSNSQYAKAKIDISHLNGLEDKAESVAEVTVDQKTLRLAMKFLKDSDPDEKKIKELIAGIEGIWVRVFEFEKEGEYLPADYEKLKAQLQGPGWIQLAGVRSRKKEKMDLAVSIMTDDNDNLLGLAIIAAEPQQLVVVNIVGTFDPAKIRELSGNFKIPDLQLEGIGIVKKKNKDKDKPEKEESEKK